MTRHCQITIASSSSWDHAFELDRFCSLELEFWHANLAQLNAKQCCKPLLSYNKIIYSDASQNACGSLILGHERTVSHKMFSEAEQE